MEENSTRSQIGRKGRAAGKRHELSVRKELQQNGWIVVKWTNQVDFSKNALVPAKSKYNPFLKRVMSEGSGFPDYLCFKRAGDVIELVGVESKMGKYLDAEERKKVRWLLDNKIFNYVFVAYKYGRGKIGYECYK